MYVYMFMKKRRGCKHTYVGYLLQVLTCTYQVYLNIQVPRYLMKKYLLDFVMICDISKYI